MKFVPAHLFLLFFLPFCLTAQQATEDDTYHHQLEAWKKQKEAIEKLNQDKVDARAAREKFNAGNALYRQADYAASVKAFLEAIALDPRFQKAYTNLGLAYKQLGDYPNALISYDRALALTNGDKDITMKTTAYKIKLLIETKDFEMAVKTINFYPKENPVDAVILYDFARCYSAVGDYAKALDWGREALELSRDGELTAALNFELGEIYKKSGRPAEAGLYYRKAMASDTWRELAAYQLKELESN